MKPKCQLFICFYIVFLSVFPLSPAASETVGKWEWENPYPQLNSLNRVWGAAADDVFAVGDYGTIIHYNGKKWEIMANPVAGAYTTSLKGVWGSSGKDVFAAGDGGIILHYDGSAWTQMESGTDQNLRSIWGISGKQVFAVGNEGTALLYDGTKWSAVPVDATDSQLSIGDVFGNSAGRIFAVSCSAVFQYDGTAFKNISPDADGCPRFVYRTSYKSILCGNSGQTLFTVATVYNASVSQPSYNSIVRKFDGNTWTDIPLPTERKIEGTAYDSEGNPVVYIDYQTFRYGIYGIWDFAENNLFAAGIREDITRIGVGSSSGVILHYDGNEWTEMLTGGNPFSSIWGSSPDNIFAVGGEGRIFHYDGSAWTQMSRNITPHTLNAVWGTSEENIYAVGQYGAILHFGAGQWTTITPPVGEDFNDIWGSGENDIFISGNNNTLVHYDGQSWTKMDIPEAGGFNDLNGIWGNSGQNIFVVGNSGRILHYDGTGWAAMESGTDKFLYSIWGSSGDNIFAGGAYAILHYDGTGWNETLYDLFSSSIYAIWGSSGNDIYFGGGGLHYDGQHWASSSGDFRDALDISGTSASNIFAVGEGGTIYHYDGTAWTKMASNTAYRINGVWAASENSAIAVGYGGTILRYSVSEVVPEEPGDTGDGGGSGGCFLEFPVSEKVKVVM